MRPGATTRRPGAASMVVIAASIGASVAISITMDLVLVAGAQAVPADIVMATVLFNVTVVLMSAVGALIELRHAGHRIGWLLLLGGPLYAALAIGWTTAETVEPYIDRDLYLVLNWAGLLLSYPGVALIVGWLPLLFPSGTLPGPRWRVPAALLVILPTIGTIAWAIRPGSMVEGVDLENPFGLAGWPGWLQPFIDLIPLALLALIVLAAAGLTVRYRRGRPFERLQIRWFLASTSVILIGFGGVFAERAIRSDDEILLSVTIAYAGILLLPIAIGMAVLRYRLYEIDRLISRTIGWALVTSVLVAVFAGGVLALQAVLSAVTQGQTLAVAASTLMAFALFQPLRRRIQHAVDRRFDRARYDGERTATAFAERLRDQVDLVDLEADIGSTVASALRPSATGLWLRRGDGRETPANP